MIKDRGDVFEQIIRVDTDRSFARVRDHGINRSNKLGWKIETSISERTPSFPVNARSAKTKIDDAKCTWTRTDSDPRTNDDVGKETGSVAWVRCVVLWDFRRPSSRRTLETRPGSTKQCLPGERVGDSNYSRVPPSTNPSLCLATTTRYTLKCSR